MHRFSPLLISMIVLASLLAHHMHAPVANVGVLAEPAVAAASSHQHHNVQDLQIVDHGLLDDILPELCSIGDPAPPVSSGMQGHVVALPSSTDTALFLADRTSTSAWETPVTPPDVFRALLQVYLN